ncbi:MAG: hypothetical protein GX591_15660 [Planctomycetes bacterium]|nr:hypothetical protein [Planctomycetota bacterium]
MVFKRTAAVVYVIIAMLGGWAAWAGAQPAAADSQAIASLKQLVKDKAPASAPVLRAALGDADPIARRLAVYGLQRIGDAANAASIRPLLADPDVWVRRTAATALGKLRDAGSVDALIGALSDEDVLVRHDAFVALGRIGAPARQTQIIAAMKDRRLWLELPPWQQIGVLNTLARPWFTDPAGAGLLRDMLSYAQWDHPRLAGLEPERREAASLLITNRIAQILALRYRDASGMKYLIAGLSSDDYMQQMSAEAAGAAGSSEAVDALVAMLNRSRWPANRRRALEALGSIGAQGGLEAVTACLADKDVRIRRGAAGAFYRITGEMPAVDLSEPAAAEIPQIDPADLNTPGGKHPPQFIVLGVDDCADIEGLEAMVDIVETLRAHGSAAVFTMWLAPLQGDFESRDMLKQKLLLQWLFDEGCEIAHHTLHHDPGGRNWNSLPFEIQIEEIEGCTQWYRDNITGFSTRPFSHKGGGGGAGEILDREFTRQLLARQNFIYGGGRGRHPNEQTWAVPTTEGMMRIPGGCLDAGAPPVHAVITDQIHSDYSGMFDYEIEDGVAMLMGNLDYHYNHPRRPLITVNGFHDWGFKSADDSCGFTSHHNQAAIVKAFLMEVLVHQKDKYPDTHCVTFRQIYEYVNTAGDLERTLAIGNGQDGRNPLVAEIVAAERAAASR